MNAAADQGGAHSPAPAESAARETALIVRILAGERELFHDLIRPYERGLYLAAYSVVLNRTDAEDIAQDAVIKAFQALKNFRGDSRFSTWLMSIALNEARSRWRKTAGQRLDSLDDAPADSGDYTPSVLADWRYVPSEQLERQELREMLRDAMAQLSPNYREVLILRDVRGLSVAETAAATGVSENLVKVRLFRARISMQKLLAPRLASRQPGARRGWLAWLTRKAGGQ